jgi:hypothetical protein
MLVPGNNAEKDLKMLLISTAQKNGTGKFIL